MSIQKNYRDTKYILQDWCIGLDSLEKKKMIDKFLDELGFSPFMKLIEGQSVIDGCVKGG